MSAVAHGSAGEGEAASAEHTALAALVVDALAARFVPGLRACLVPLLLEHERRLLAALSGPGSPVRCGPACSQASAGVTGTENSLEMVAEGGSYTHRHTEPTSPCQDDPPGGEARLSILDFASDPIMPSSHGKSKRSRPGPGSSKHKTRRGGSKQGSRDPWNRLRNMLQDTLGAESSKPRLDGNTFLSVQSLEDARNSELLAPVIAKQTLQDRPKRSGHGSVVASSESFHSDMSDYYDLVTAAVARTRTPSASVVHTESLPRQAQEEPTRITCRIDRTTGSSLGIDVSRNGSAPFTISAIREGGLVDGWNAKQPPNRQLRAGDSIVEVNGETQAVMEPLRTDKVLKITVARRAPPVRSTTPRPTPPAAVPAAPPPPATSPPAQQPQTAQARPEAAPARRRDQASGSSDTQITEWLAELWPAGWPARQTPPESAGAAGSSPREQPALLFGPSGSSRTEAWTRRPEQEAETPPQSEQGSTKRRGSVDSNAEGCEGQDAALPGVPRNRSMTADNCVGTRARLDSGEAGRAQFSSDPPKGSRDSQEYKSWASATSLVAKIPDGEGCRPNSFCKEAHVLRIEREETLLRVITEDANSPARSQSASPCDSDEGDAATTWPRDGHVTAPLLLRVCGVMPWRESRLCSLSMLYRLAVFLLTGGIAGIFGERLVRLQAAALDTMDCENGMCVQFGQICDLVLAVGSLVGLAALARLASSGLLGSGAALLSSYARRQQVVPHWWQATRRQLLLLAFLWLGSVGLRLRVLWLSSSWQDALAVGAFVAVSVIFTGLTFCILHVSCAITVLIDAYCTHFSNEPDVRRGVQDWNMLQALLRKVSRALKWGFLALQTTALAIALFSVSGLLLDSSADAVSHLSNMVLPLSVGLIIFKAAEVTERCSRVPSLINSLSIDSEDIDQGRHYLVEYVTYSAAGFYVGEVRLTAAMALKLTYISGVAALGVLTKITATA